MFYRSCLVLLLGFSTFLVNAEDEASVGEWDFSVALGYGQFESPIGYVDKQNLYVLPNVRYYGERFFMENTTLGYTLLEEDNFYIDAVTRLNEDGLYFKLEDFGALSAVGLDSGRGSEIWGIEDIERDISYMGGLSASYQFDNLHASIRWFKDISGVHHGQEAELSLVYANSWGDWGLKLEGIARYKDEDLLQYYYQVEQHESIIFVGLYQPGSGGMNYDVRINLTRKINDSWSWLAFYKRTFLADEISDSIIIADDCVDLYFMGLKYDF